MAIVNKWIFWKAYTLQLIEPSLRIPQRRVENRNINIETDKVGNVAWDHLMMCITFLILDGRNKKKLKDEFIERYSGDDQLTDTGLESA